MRFQVMPLEERIVLDAAGAFEILHSYYLDSVMNHSAVKMGVAPDAAQHENSVLFDSNATSPSGIHVLVISSAIKDPSVLVAAAQNSVHVVLYDPSHTSLQELTQKIATSLDGQQADSIAFVTEGAPGQFALTGNVLVNVGTLQSNVALQTFWHDMNAMVKSSGHIDLLACDVGADANGVTLVHDISQLVNGAQVDASTGLVGDANLGGSWVLALGNVNVAPVYFNIPELSHWDHVLGEAPVAFNVPLPAGVHIVDGMPIVTLNGSVYFIANENQIWKNDGTMNGSSMVAQVNLAAGTTLGNLTVFNNELYFSANTGSGYEVYTTTDNGVVTAVTNLPGLSALGSNDNGSGPVTTSSFFTANGELYFVGTTTAIGTEPYVTNGTIAGTTLLDDINSGTASSSPTHFTAVNGVVIFSANDGPDGFQLWATDGTPAGTFMLTDINPSPNGGASPGSSFSASNPFENEIVPINGDSLAFFSANLGTNTAPALSLWITNGTTTSMVDNLNFFGSSPTSLTSMIGFSGGALGAGVPGVIFGLTYSSGNMIAVAESDAVVPISSPSNLSFNDAVVFNNLVYFSGTQGGSSGLWTTDGNTTTNQVASFANAPTNLTAFGNTLVFSASDGVTGTELWQTDGSTVTFVKDIVPGSTGSQPHNFTSNGEALFFQVLNTSDSGLWTTGNPIQLNDQSYSGSANQPLTINTASGLLNGSHELNGESIQVTSNTSPSSGIVSINLDGSFSYTPNSGFAGVDSFQYQVTNMDGVVRTGNAFITVLAPPPSPPPSPPSPTPEPTPIHPPVAPTSSPDTGNTTAGNTESTAPSSSGTESSSGTTTSSSVTTTTTTTNETSSPHTSTGTTAAPATSSTTAVIPLIQETSATTVNEHGVSFHHFSQGEGTVDSALHDVAADSAALSFLNHEAYTSAANAIYFATHYKANATDADEGGLSLEDSLSMVDFLPDTHAMTQTEKTLYLYGKVGISLFALKIVNSFYHSAIKAGIQRAVRKFSLEWIARKLSLD